MKRLLRMSALALAVQLLCGIGVVQAQKYRYGGGSGSRSGGAGEGVLVILEGGVANPRNTDNVIATRGWDTSSPEQIIPDWEDEGWARIGVGYQWASGSRVMGTLWSFETTQDAVATGTTRSLAFAVGPPIAAGVGDAGNAASIKTEITMQTADVDWGRTVPVSSKFDASFSIGGRYATFEEKISGLYTDSSLVNPSFTVGKLNEGKMFGGRISGRGIYWIGPFYLTSGLAYSFMSGEISGSTGLTQLPAVTAASRATIKDTSRSGTILDFDIAFAWNNSNRNVAVLAGWEQSRWDDIAADLVRNFPNTLAPLRDRNSITISAFKLGVHLRF